MNPNGNPTPEDPPQHDADSMAAQLYTELRRLAACRIANEDTGQSLSATDLIHEAYVRLTNGPARQLWENRAHFLTAAAEAMRRILIERARRKQRLKHGGGRRRADLAEAEIVAPAPADNLLELDEALTRLEAVHSQKAQLVKLRYFTGLTIEEAAEVLGISRTSAHRHWSYARAWLHREMCREDN